MDERDTCGRCGRDTPWFAIAEVFCFQIGKSLLIKRNLLIRCSLQFEMSKQNLHTRGCMLCSKGESEKRLIHIALKANLLNEHASWKTWCGKRMRRKVALTSIGLHIESFLKFQGRWGNFAESLRNVLRQGNWLTICIFGNDPPIRWEPIGGCMLRWGDSEKWSAWGGG